MRSPFICVTVLLLAGCTTVAGAGSRIQFQTVSRGAYSAVQEADAAIIRTPEEFARVWAALHRGSRPEPPLPEVDFKREMVAAVFQGQQPTGGYAVAVERIEQLEDRVVIHVTAIQPRPEDFVTMALTSPYHLVRLPRRDLPVEFQFDAAGRDASSP